MLKAMKYYISNHYESGTLLHREGCNLIPKSLDDRTFIGTLYTALQAMTVALQHHHEVGRCLVCLKQPNNGQADAIEEGSIKSFTKPATTLVQRTAAKAKKRPAIAGHTCQLAERSGITHATVMLNKNPEPQQILGPQRVVKIKNDLQVVAVQHSPFHWQSE